MNERTGRILLAALTVGSVIFTPVLGTFGPFNNGAEDASLPRAYFLPAGYVFAIWGVNYLGLLALGVWGALPAQAANPRARAAAPWLAVTALFNAVWIVLAGSTALVPWTVPVLLVMEVSGWLAYLSFRPQQQAGQSRLERGLLVPLRVYLGWLSVATVANSASALNVLGWNGFGLDPVTWTLVMLVAATAVAGVVGWLMRDNVYRGVFVWAFIGIVVAQSDVPAVAITAGLMAAAVALMIALSGPRQGPRLERRAA